MSQEKWLKTTLVPRTSVLRTTGANYAESAVAGVYWAFGGSSRGQKGEQLDGVRTMILIKAKLVES